MNLQAWPALILLLSAAVLVMLAAWRTGPRRREVGTLMIWRRVAGQPEARKQRRRDLDWLFWLLLAVVGVSAVGAARPAWLKPPDRPVVGVFVERGLGGHDNLRARVEAELGDARAAYFTPGDDPPPGWRGLNPGTIESELAQFHARADGADAYLYVLNHAIEDLPGRVLPRVDRAVEGVVFEIDSRGDELVVRHSGRGGVVIRDAEVLSSETSGRVTTLRAASDAPRVEVAGRETHVLTRRPFVVGVGPSWSGDAHRALFSALRADSAETVRPAVWLGADERSPAVRIQRGVRVDLTGCELSFDPQHPLFHELPLASFDWRAMGRVMPREGAARPLVTALRDGEIIGNIVRLDGDVIEFAGDPFRDAPIASAALLLDNAIGVVTGEQPSRRRTFEPVGVFELPTRRAATAEPFEPFGDAGYTLSTADEPVEFSTWLLLAGALLLLACVAVLTRRSGQESA